MFLFWRRTRFVERSGYFGRLLPPGWCHCRSFLKCLFIYFLPPFKIFFINFNLLLFLVSQFWNLHVPISTRYLIFFFFFLHVTLIYCLIILEDHFQVWLESYDSKVTALLWTIFGHPTHLSLLSVMILQIPKQKYTFFFFKPKYSVHICVMHHCIFLVSIFTCN